MTATCYRKKLGAMEAGTLDPNDFNHLDHIGVAVEALRKYGFFEAVSRYSDGLRALTQRAGVPEKYNATITFASMSLIAERLHTGDYDDAESFVRKNGTLFTRSFLTDQFPEERIGTDLAREIPLLPVNQFSADPRQSDR